MIKLLSAADIVSIINAIFGFCAIIIFFTSFIYDLSLKIHLALSLIFLGILADGLDGILARQFKKSDVGEILDSMADMTTLVIAPAILVYFVYLNNSTDLWRFLFLMIALFLFLSFGIVRLGSFHIMKNKDFYVGLPTPASTIILVTLAYLEVNYLIILFSVIVIGALMASDFIFPKPDKRMDIAALILILLTIVFAKNYYSFAPIMLLLGIFIFTFGGPVYSKFFKK